MHPYLNPDPRIVLHVHDIIAKLKTVRRAGWTLQPGQDQAFKPRNVQNPESVADHSFALVMLAAVTAGVYEVDPLRFMLMAAAHDLAEAEHGDPVTAILSGAELERALEKKRTAEMAYMQSVHYAWGSFGERLYHLFCEYEERTTPMARALRDLDLLEAVLQAYDYSRRREDLDPKEFSDHVQGKLLHPFSVRVLDLILKRAASFPF